jgi:hypothetical protein
VYELAYDGGGKDGQPFLIGLLDPARLAHEYDPKVAGGNGHLAGSTRPLGGPVAGGSREGGNGREAAPEAANGRMA